METVTLTHLDTGNAVGVVLSSADRTKLWEGLELHDSSAFPVEEGHATR